MQIIRFLSEQDNYLEINIFKNHIFLVHKLLRREDEL